MRTTLTLADDVVRAIEKIEHETGAKRKEVVNDLLRRALATAPKTSPRRRRFQTRIHSVGKLLLDDYDDVQTLLDIAEGEGRRG